MNYYIITGTSRGMGEAIAKRLLIPGNVLICISRTENEDLSESASNLNIPLYYFIADLSIPGEIEKLADDLFAIIDPGKATSAALINNAGMVLPVGYSGNLEILDMQAHYNLNLLAPAILSNLFIHKLSKFRVPKVILNISSGAADYATSGWSMYCSSKAGLDMLTRVIGMEQASPAYPVKVFSLHPGIIDTSMQEELRGLEEDAFPEKSKYTDLFEQGLLVDPSEVADVIVHSVFNPGIPQGSILTLQQLKEYYIK